MTVANSPADAPSAKSASATMRTAMLTVLLHVTYKGRLHTNPKYKLTLQCCGAYVGRARDPEPVDPSDGWRLRNEFADPAPQTRILAHQ